MKRSKKAQVNFGNATNVVLALVVTAMVAAAGVVAMAGFKDGITQNYTPNVTHPANDSLDNAISGLGNFTNQFGTIGTILGVSLLLLLIVGVFAAVATRNNGL